MLRNIQKPSVAREKVKFERGLDLVPLLIHLPPVSEDIEGGGRDARDVTDENISKALTIYNIISSTVQKGFAYLRHGQKHFGFEIVGTQGYVHLYALAPAEYIDVIEQAITTAYPSTRLERRPEYNIFSEQGGIQGIAGGRFSLKENYAYPIATYQDLKKDTFQGILNALSTIENQDGAAIQILFRPLDDGWRKSASDFAKSKRKGTDKALKVGQFAKDFIGAFNKVPENKGDDKGRDLSAAEQAVLESIEAKTQYAGFEVAIRTIASSASANEAKSIINNIVSSFSLFNAPGKNGFAFTHATDANDLVTNFLLRVFPHEKKKSILNVVELATLFHFPDQSSTPTSQLGRQDSKQVDAPRNMPENGLMLGYNLFRGIKKPIRLGLKDRQRHMYAVGQTGTGKSTFLENLALQDMLNGDGFAFVDPHGDTAEKLLSMVPKERVEDIIYFCPSDMDYPMGMNLFEYHTDDQKDFLIQEVLNMLYKLYDPQHQGIMGPRYEDMFRNAALVIMADPNGGTFVDIPKLFRDPQFLKQKLQHVKDQTVLDFWTKQFPASQRSNEAGEVTAWFVSKFGAFLSNEMMRNIIGQSKSAFNLRDIMDNKKILLVNLSKGRTGDLNSKLLGMMFVMKFQAAAMSRANVPEDDRVDFALYVDEFQNFSTDSFATILSEARKYHLNLIVANQFTTQLSEEIRDAVFGNIGTIVAFRVGQNDVDSLSRYFQPQFDADDLLRVPNYNAIVRTMVNGVPTQPFSMAALPPLGNPNAKLATALKQLTAAKYGRPKAMVEKEIFARLETKTPQGGGMSGQQPSAGSFGGGQAMPAPSQPKQGSFLDEWVAKQQRPAATTSTAFPQTTPQGYAPSAPSGQPVAQPAYSVDPASSRQQAPSPQANDDALQAPDGSLKIQR
ncbi:MAG: hypothetical protein QG629_926 [Patescibacteria group bacterium]|nr:ATP-binding protein [Candidatus Saccharibacteria bacterium]MDQ5963843.1 hypothetical protein [Patescibacteria group bacterium]